MKIKVPTKWSDVTIKKYIALIELEQVTDIDPIEKRAQRLAIACDCTYNEALNIPLHTIEEIEAKLAFMNTLPSQKFVNEFVLGGKWYVVNPDLKAFTPAQFITFKEYVKDGKIMENLHFIATCFCIERGVPYKDVDNDVTAKLFYEELTLDVVYPISAFFLNFWNDSQTVIADYLTGMEIQMLTEIVEEEEAMQKGSATDGAGIQS